MHGRGSTPAAPGLPKAATMARTFTPRDRMENPLLGQEPLPQFLQIRPEHVEPAVREVLTQNRARIEELASLPHPPSRRSSIRSRSCGTAFRAPGRR